jgi:multidrug efflux system membrane fusion protein
MPFPLRESLLRIARACLALAAACVLASCSPDSKPHAEPAAPVAVAQVEKKSVPEFVTAVGSVEAINSVAIKSLVEGQLLESRVKDGDDVRKGQLLFRIDPRPAQAALAQANAALAKDEAARDMAGAQVTRYKPIAAQHYISADQMQQYLTAYEAAAASVRVDQANVESMKLTLAYTDIHAPIDGRAGRNLEQAGNLVKANDTQALLTINQLAPIFVNFAVPGDQVDRVRAAQARGTLAVQASGDGIEGKIAGTLSFVDNAIDPATNTVKLRASFANADERLWPGQFVNISLTLGNDANALAVPDAAVKAGPNGNYVFVVEGGIAKQRDVTVARSVDGESMIAKGLAAGETVVTDGQSRLVDGARVDVAETRVSGGQDDAAKAGGAAK